LKISKKISEFEIFKNKPITLMHIGSSGSDFKKWSNISRNSLLVSIDANKISESSKTKFRKIVSSNSIISNSNKMNKFYLTKDSHCSSLLEPNQDICKIWYGSHRFNLKKILNRKTTSINNFLKKNKIKNIDWIVLDVQGKDLDIIKSLGKDIRNNISIINIETGFYSFYKKADTINEVFKYMSNKFQFEDMTFGLNYKTSSKGMSKLEKLVLFNMENPTKIYSNIIFLNKKNNSERLNLIKLIYLIESNKIFEAKNFLENCLNKYPYYETINKEINFLIKVKKLKFIFLSPFFILKKFLSFFKKN